MIVRVYLMNKFDCKGIIQAGMYISSMGFVLNTLVSFIMPAYNAAGFISETIISIQEQKYQNYELIVVNDGSTDDTAEVVKGLAKKNKKIILIEKENTGIVDSLNIGIKNSIGSYIARIDADDLCLAERIEKQIEFMNEYDLDLCGSGLEQFGETTKKKYYPQSHDEVLVNLATYGRTIPHPTVLGKKEVFENFPYSSDYPHAEDFALWIEIVMTSNYKVGNCPEALIKYRVHEGQISQQKKQIQLESVVKATNIYLKKFCDDLSEDELRYNFMVCKGHKILSLEELKQYREFL